MSSFPISSKSCRRESFVISNLNKHSEGGRYQNGLLLTIASLFFFCKMSLQGVAGAKLLGGGLKLHTNPLTLNLFVFLTLNWNFQALVSILIHIPPDGVYSNNKLRTCYHKESCRMSVSDSYCLLKNTKRGLYCDKGCTNNLVREETENCRLYM